METPDSLSLEIYGVKAAATGSVAIIILTIAVVGCGALFLVGKKRSWW